MTDLSGLFFLDGKGTKIMPVPPGTTERYLGMWINLSDDWTVSDRVLLKAFWQIYYTIKNNWMSIKAAAATVNLFLVPMILRFLRMARFAYDRDAVSLLNTLQGHLNRLFASLNGFPHPRNWQGPITPLLLGFKDLAQHAITLNLEALHLNLNYHPEKFVVAATTHDRLASLSSFFRPVAAPSAAGSPMSSSGVDTHFDQLIESLDPCIRALDSPLALPPTMLKHNDTAKRLLLAHTQGLSFMTNNLHLGSAHMNLGVQTFPVSPQQTNGRELEHPAHQLILCCSPPFLPAEHFHLDWEVDPYSYDWCSNLVSASSAAPSSNLIVFTDGSSKRRQCSGSSAVWFAPSLDRVVLTVSARLKGMRRNYVPECVGCLMALAFTPLNWPLEIVCD